MDQVIVNYDVYEDSNRYDGTASVTLPDISFLTQSLSGAGIAGNIEAVVAGHMDAMTLTMTFRTIQKEAISLTEPKRHQIELRAAQQIENTVSGELESQNIKHTMVVIPKKLSGGQLAPHSAANASGEYAVRYWAMYIDGKKRLELDPLNYICVINGTDYLASVRKALGR